MSYTSTSVSFSSLEDSEEYWVNMAQPSYSSDLTLTDIQQMFALASGGYSAFNYQRDSCPVSVVDASGSTPAVATIVLDFFSYKSSDDLDVTFTADVGTVSTVGVDSIEVNEVVIFELSNYVELPYRIVSPVLTWESPLVTQYGELLSDEKSVTITGNKLVVDEPVFGVLLLQARAVTTLHRLTIIVELENGFKYSNLAPTVTAVVNGYEDNAETLSLTVPDCVSTAVSICSSGSTTSSSSHSSNSETGEVRGVRKVYYSSCDGSILKEEAA